MYYIISNIPQVERELQQRKLDKEYAGILGYHVFTQAAIELVLGKEDKHVQDHLVSSSVGKLLEGSAPQNLQRALAAS